MARSLLACAVALFFVLALCARPAAAQEAAQGDRHMLWTVSSDAGVEGYLVGSVHLMKPEAYPLAEAFDEAFAAADVVAFEADQDSMTAQAQTLTMRLGVYPGGQTLESELSDTTYAALEAWAAELGLPLAQLQRLEPWMIALMVPVIQIQQAGYAPQSGIDAHFFAKAKEAGTPRVAFETPEEQLGFFDTMPPQEQEAFLKHGLDEAEETVAMMDEMTAAWRAGDAGTLERLLQDEMQQQFPALYQTLVVDRNDRWMPEIVRLLGDEAVPLIVVGAAHIVGEDGLTALLEAEGYRVDQQ